MAETLSGSRLPIKGGWSPAVTRDKVGLGVVAMEGKREIKKDSTIFTAETTEMDGDANSTDGRSADEVNYSHEKTKIHLLCKVLNTSKHSFCQVLRCSAGPKVICHLRCKRGQNTTCKPASCTFRTKAAVERRGRA